MWNLYQKGKFLEPLKFSNGKTQEDVVKEILDAIKEDHKIIFIHGICGTGKSAIALNISRHLGKASVVVPGKNLQSQYKKDYEEDKYITKDNGERLKINVITGRKNHKCKFLEDNQNAIPVIKKEVNSKLHNIFAGKKEEMNKVISNDLSADNINIPCKIEIKEKNWHKIKQYLNQNKNVNAQDFNEIGDVKRASVGGVCPYWSPVLPDKYDLKQFKDHKKKKYTGLDNTEFNFYLGKQGCKFYEQFNSFVDSDIIVFNSLKYKLESALNRKPLTEVEIIDECDEFLDSFSNQRNLNIDRIQNSLVHVLSSGEKAEQVMKEISEIVKQIKQNKRILGAIESNEIIPLRATGIYDLFKVFLNSPEFFYEIDDENYLLEVEEIARAFEEFMDESYLTVSKKENSLIVSIVTTNLAKKFREMVDKNKRIVLMSGTLHSNDVLKNIFGLDDFKIIEAEVEHQGRIEVMRTGLEMDCKYSNFKTRYSREDYLLALDKCVEKAKKPVLIHVNAFNDLPTRDEIKEFEVDNLISREELREIQMEDNTGELVARFKKGEVNVLFSTRCGRGIDFPGEECNSIVLTKYPNPNVQNAFWKILAQTRPQHYWSFYKDKARRELWQKIYRGVRFNEDHVFVLSPDTRVLEFFEK